MEKVSYTLGGWGYTRRGNIFCEFMITDEGKVKGTGR
jgi:hypothetical protein